MTNRESFRAIIFIPYYHNQLITALSNSSSTCIVLASEQQTPWRRWRDFGPHFPSQGLLLRRTSERVSSLFPRNCTRRRSRKLKPQITEGGREGEKEAPNSFFLRASERRSQRFFWHLLWKCGPMRAKVSSSSSRSMLLACQNYTRWRWIRQYSD